LSGLPGSDLAEKLTQLALTGPPAAMARDSAACLADLSKAITRLDTGGLHVVIFGGGTGLSNILGGDSRTPGWPQAPFSGLKEIFPRSCSIVCVTDDGGSTGELLKDLPLIALGDIRHVLLSSIQMKRLRQLYDLSEDEAVKVVGILHAFFNYRYNEQPGSAAAFFKTAGFDLAGLPEGMRQPLASLVSGLFTDRRFQGLLQRPHCLGNLVLAAAIYKYFEDSGAERPVPSAAISDGLRYMAHLLGASAKAVIPCTTTPAWLQVLYANGVLVTGEFKSSYARRGYPVDRVFLKFADEPRVPAKIKTVIQEADIIILAPGSLYTSIIPVFQVPGLAEAVRGNRRALKILLSNLWVQKGETDVVRDDPGRRFYVSDLIRAYHRNIPGGVHELFKQVLVLGLRDIPGSILQNYALEDKVPIYLDRENVRRMGFLPVEAGIFSQKSLRERLVVQHDPEAVAIAIRTLWAIRQYLPVLPDDSLPRRNGAGYYLVSTDRQLPSQRYEAMSRRIDELSLAGNREWTEALRGALREIIWRHADIPIDHLLNVRGLDLIEPADWHRSQQWDNVFSFYDPTDGFIKVRRDVFDHAVQFEVAFLVALGQALLGNYAEAKSMNSVERDGDVLGRVYRLKLRPASTRCCYFNEAELDRYLHLARMTRATGNPLFYSRLINADEGFTPPGLLFGLTYAWYLDNRFATHIEYKMAIMRDEITNLIPEQIRQFTRRKTLIDFFRQVVFRHDASLYDYVFLDTGRRSTLPRQTARRP